MGHSRVLLQDISGSLFTGHLMAPVSPLVLFTGHVRALEIYVKLIVIHRKLTYERSLPC